MVTYYNRKDLVSFGNYIEKAIRTGKKREFPDGTYPVTHADIENWKYEELKNKNHSIDQ